MGGLKSVKGPGAVVLLREYTGEDKDIVEVFKRKSKHNFLTNCFWFA